MIDADQSPGLDQSPGRPEPCRDRSALASTALPAGETDRHRESKIHPDSYGEVFLVWAFEGCREYALVVTRSSVPKHIPV
eukprot:1987434-Rhodomonas_salina.1